MKYLRILISFFVAAVLIYVVVQWTDADIWDSVKKADATLLGAGFVLFGVVLCLASLRFQLLLSVLCIGISFTRAVRLTLMGSFFNLVIPGSVSGDVVKMALITHHTDGKKTEAAFIVFIDRMLGLFGLLALTVLVLCCFSSFVAGLGRDHGPVQIAVYVIGIGSSLSVAAVLLVEMRETLLRIGAIQKIVTKISQKLPGFILSFMQRVVEVLEIYRRNRKILLSGLLISVLIHFLLALILFCIGSGVGDENPSVPGYLITTSVANAVAAIPLTPAGLGTRDGTIALFLNAMKVPSDIIGTIPILMSLIMVVWYLTGGILLLFYKKPKTSLQVE
ncbi:MAG: flippase-like domain-containing protein [Acidobacteria bacterium]|nr:flippase-like domain-containing protein [Acidobacteriota bacterium]